MATETPVSADQSFETTWPELPYTAIMETEPCKRCGEGESWTVKGPDGLCIGRSWTGDDAECNAEEAAQELNAAYEAGRAARVADEQIKHMVDRFLGWRLPENFAPDAGISFQPEYNVEYNSARGLPPARHQPSGTNLFDAVQAEAMIRYMIEGMP